MGRWGWRLFEVDQDLDIACDLKAKLGITDDDWEWTPTNTVNHSDMLAPADARAIYQTKEYADELKNTIIPYVREKFDKNNLGYDLFAKCRCLDEDLLYGKYPVIIFGAMMMRVGAKMKEEDLQYLRDLAPTIHSSPGYVWFRNDQGFRDPGRTQFLAALDHYQAGVPRSFAEPRDAVGAKKLTIAELLASANTGKTINPGATFLERAECLTTDRVLPAR
ncbi:hypothetical protein N7488_007902 [Penicillium malachiteum]|nr:hypothetical protein N7488_007902 [Penicillium malachiteum]